MMSLGGQLRQRWTLQPAPRLRDEGARARSRTLGDAERDSWIVILTLGGVLWVYTLFIFHLKIDMVDVSLFHV